MNTIAVISDIHANLHALEAVLAEIRSLRIREVVCLGDVVGYGPYPAECLDLVMSRCRHTVLGNHDEAVFNDAAARNFNGPALAALQWTRSALPSRHVDLLRLLPHLASIEPHVMCIHDCPAPAPTDYVHDTHMAAIAFRGVERRVCLLGHTHVPAVFESDSTDPDDHLTPSRVASFVLGDRLGVPLRPGRRYICNPGSVGQPRDADPRASFGILNLRKWTFGVRRVAYDVDAAQAATRRAGLPTILAERLAVGA